MKSSVECVLCCIGREFIIICVCDRKSLCAVIIKDLRSAKCIATGHVQRETGFLMNMPAIYEFNMSEVNMTTEFVYVWETKPQLLIILSQISDSDIFIWSGPSEM